MSESNYTVNYYYILRKSISALEEKSQFLYYSNKETILSIIET